MGILMWGCARGRVRMHNPPPRCLPLAAPAVPSAAPGWLMPLCPRYGPRGLSRWGQHSVVQQPDHAADPPDAARAPCATAGPPQGKHRCPATRPGGCGSAWVPSAPRAPPAAAGEAVRAGASGHLPGHQLQLKKPLGLQGVGGQWVGGFIHVSSWQEPGQEQELVSAAPVSPGAARPRALSQPRGKGHPFGTTMAGIFGAQR